MEALIDSIVLSVEDIEIESVEDNRGRQEHDEFYGAKITTSKGYTDIVYRNSSNGYYGGGCFICEEPSENMIEITEDWSA